MREIPAPLAARFAEGVTTLCHGWRVTRRDGTLLGFTDHDRDLDVDGLTFVAASGISGSENVSAQGLAVTGAEVSGALSADALTEADIAAGLYDGAAIDLLLIDWSAPQAHLLIRRGRLGEVRRQDGAFVCEVRALADGLNEVRGRLFTAQCDADLGDQRCGIDLSHPAHRGEGAVAAVSGALGLAASGLNGFSAGVFTGGRITFVSGASQGFACEVKSHRADGGTIALELWQAPPAPLALGDAFHVTAGCDRRFETCRDRFANALNFRGFPHIPGNDFVITVAVPGDGGYDGSLLR